MFVFHFEFELTGLVTAITFIILLILLLCGTYLVFFLPGVIITHLELKDGHGIFNMHSDFSVCCVICIPAIIRPSCVKGKTWDLSHVL